MAKVLCAVPGVIRRELSCSSSPEFSLTVHPDRMVWKAVREMKERGKALATLGFPEFRGCSRSFAETKVHRVDEF